MVSPSPPTLTHFQLVKIANNSDPAVKQILVYIDNNLQKIILQDLDETHVLVKEDMVQWIKEQVNTEVRYTNTLQTMVYNA